MADFGVLDYGKLCLQYRAKHNLSQKAMARTCGVCRETIVALENGHRISKLTQNKLLTVVTSEQ